MSVVLPNVVRNRLAFGPCLSYMAMVMFILFLQTLKLFGKYVNYKLMILLDICFPSNLRSYEISGPLSMFPPADDNYGVDASSILFLHSAVPLLVIATAYGIQYNCVLLAEVQLINFVLGNIKISFIAGGVK